MLTRIWLSFKLPSYSKAFCLFLLWVEVRVMQRESQKYLRMFLLSRESVQRKAFPQDLNLNYSQHDYEVGDFLHLLMQSLSRQQFTGEVTDSTVVG